MNFVSPVSSVLLFLCLATVVSGQSVARQWDEECLSAIRSDFPAPTVHARNLFHFSAAMADAWSAYTPESVGVFHNEVATAANIESARDEAVTYAAYRVLKSRYAISVNATAVLASFDRRMDSLGFPTNVTTTEGTSPAAVGNRAAAAVLAAAANDGSNEENNYADNTGYEPINNPMIFAEPGTGALGYPNRWQPLAFEFAQTQNGQVAGNIQIFIGAHWGSVTPFALAGSHVDGLYSEVDPGAPPFLDGVGDEEYRQGALDVIRFSATLDPSSDATIDISPGAHGNSTLGTNDGTGYALNPITGAPYAPNVVNLADYGRVLAEFWADGPHSETPPGHWNVLANQVADTPGFAKRIRGSGDVVDDLEWDVKMYLALNSALHDSAVAAWGVKAHYDYVRPITAIRFMGKLGQSTDRGKASFHYLGLPLEDDLVELVTPRTTREGDRHPGLEVGKIVIRAWQGEPDDTDNEVGGVGWIYADSWRPYQRRTFVTPAFAGYVSGHSTFSRAAAEVLATFTGSPYFPGGLGTHTEPAGSLEFEAGPSSDITLQWATYYDAADQAGISRLYGGIHVAADDGPGRIMGSEIGKTAVAKALAYTEGDILHDFECTFAKNEDGMMEISWPSISGYHYKVQSSEDLSVFEDVTTSQSYPTGVATEELPAATQADAPKFYRVYRELP